MKIRYANLDDAEKITKNNVLLARESEKLTIEYKTVFAGVKALLSDQTKGFYLVAEEDNNIIGQMMITFEWSDWYNKNVWWLQSVYTDESWRRKGVFTQLFEAIKKLLVKIMSMFSVSMSITAIVKLKRPIWHQECRRKLIVSIKCH